MRAQQSGRARTAGSWPRSVVKTAERRPDRRVVATVIVVAILVAIAASRVALGAESARATATDRLVVAESAREELARIEGLFSGRDDRRDAAEIAGRADTSASRLLILHQALAFGGPVQPRWDESMPAELPPLRNDEVADLLVGIDSLDPELNSLVFAVNEVARGVATSEEIDSIAPAAGELAGSYLEVSDTLRSEFDDNNRERQIIIAGLAALAAGMIIGAVGLALFTRSRRVEPVPVPSPSATTLLEVIPDMIVRIRSDGRVEHVGIKASCGLLNYRREDLPASTARLIHPEDLPGVLGDEASDRSAPRGMRLRRSDGSWLRAEVVGTRSEPGATLLVLRPATERRRFRAEADALSGQS